MATQTRDGSASNTGTGATKQTLPSSASRENKKPDRQQPTTGNKQEPIHASAPGYIPAGSPTPPPLEKPGYQVFGTLRLREEAYNWFPAKQANGAYTFLDGVARAGISRATRTEDFVLEFQAPFLVGLPTHAIAPSPQGSLGQGASYQDADHNQAAGFYIKQGYFRFKNAGGSGNSVRLGRFEFRDGQETTSTDASLNWLKLNRIGQRLLSPSTFNVAGRSFDGIEGVSETRLRNITAAFFLPTRGISDLNGWDTLVDLQVGYLSATYPQPGPHASGEGRLFAIDYHDGRDGAVVKVDNRPLADAQGMPVRSADKGDIHIQTFGGNYARVEPLGDGKVDGMFWGAAQIGRWGSLRQGAFAFAAEAGYQPNLPALKPWLRVGYDYYSGDGNNSNGIHGTFIPLLTTSRTYARFPFFTEANLKDLFGQVILRPNARLTIRSDVHGLRLADSHDLWYSSGGASEIRNFGFTGRPSNGHSNLATLYDISMDYQVWRALTLSLYFAYAEGGDVVKSIYRSGDATFAYAEATYHF